MDIKKTLKKHAAPVILATAISGTALATNSVATRADEVDEATDSIVIEEDMSSHSKVTGLTETQSIVRNVVFSTRTKTTTEEKSLVSSEFDTKEEAQEWIDKRTDILEEAYEITKEEIITSTVIEQDGQPININEEFDEKKDALEKKEELESNTNNECDLTVEEKDVCHITETTVEVDEIFDTKEEQEAYKELVQDKKDLDLTEEVLTEEITHPEEKVTEITKDTKEELDNAVESVIEEIKASETDEITYETRVEEGIKEESVLGDTKEESISETFDTKEGAEAFIEEKKEETTDDITFEFEEISERTESSRDESDINEVVDSMDDVESYIDNLKSQGYEIDGYEVLDETTTIIEKIPTGNVIVKDSTKFDSDSYFESSGNFAIIKQGNGTAVVWTLEPLSESEKTSFKDSFLNSNLDPSIQDSSFEYISGTGSYDLSYIGKNWGTYLVNYKDGVITVECDEARISHLNVGTFEDEMIEEEKVVSKFRINGRKYIEENYTVYDVNGTRKEQLYENKQVYYATVYKTLKEENKKYKLTGSYIEEQEEISKKYVLKGTVTKYVQKEKYRGLIEYRRVIVDKEEPKEEKPSGQKPGEQKPSGQKPSKEENKKEEKKEEPEEDKQSPKMGDNSNLELYTAVLLASSFGLGTTLGYTIGSQKVKKKKMK